MTRVVGVAHVQWSRSSMYALGNVGVEDCKSTRGPCRERLGSDDYATWHFRMVIQLVVCARINAHALDLDWQSHWGAIPTEESVIGL